MCDAEFRRSRVDCTGTDKYGGNRCNSVSCGLGATNGEFLAGSAAALGVVKRKGCGKLRHVRVGQLWIQEKESIGELGYKKVKGEANPADAGTKYLSESKMVQFMETVLQEPVGGRAETSLKVAGNEKGR